MGAWLKSCDEAKKRRVQEEAEEGAQSGRKDRRNGGFYVFLRQGAARRLNHPIHRLTVNAVRRQRDDALPPHLRDKLLAEEKRLAYVGCTRAMERLYIVSSQVRRMT